MTAAETPDAIEGAGSYAAIPHGSCDVSPAPRSQWRNTRHWHVVWPDGNQWCYETLLDAADRRDELEAIRKGVN